MTQQRVPSLPEDAAHRLDRCGQIASPRYCFRLISMVRQIDVIATSWTELSNGCSRSRPMFCQRKKPNPIRADPMGVSRPRLATMPSGRIDPTPEELCEITIMAAEEVRRFGIEPKIALLSHSNFGTSNAPSAIKMRDTLALLKERAPDLEVDGEMHGDVALDAKLRSEVMPDSVLKGDANLLVLPNIDAANISYNLLKTAAGNNMAIGPMLLGAALPVHVLTASATVRRIVNMTALLVADAAASIR